MDRFTRKIESLQQIKAPHDRLFLCARIWVTWLWKALDGKRLTPGQLQAYPWKLGGMTVQTSYVGGRWHQNWAHTSPQHFFMSVHGNWRKGVFFRTQKFWRGNFFGASTHWILTHSGFRKYSWFCWPNLRFKVMAAQSEVKYRPCYKKSRGVKDQSHSAIFGR